MHHAIKIKSLTVLRPFDSVADTTLKRIWIPIIHKTYCFPPHAVNKLV